MHGFTRSHARGAVVAAVVLNACLGFVAPAVADDGATPTTDDATRVIEDTVAELVEDAASAAAASDSTEQDISVSDAVDGAAATVSKEGEQALDGVNAASQPAADTGDTAMDTADTTPDTATRASGSDETAPPTVGAAPAATAVSVAPSNVNVSVRIDSAGDNGAVTQLNAVTAVAVGAKPSVTKEEAPRTQSAQIASTESASSGETSVEQAPSWDWDWDCATPPQISLPVPSAESQTGVIPRIWNWTWNCGGNDALPTRTETQYHDAFSSQYLPVNISVSVRVRSSGNDGPVTQTNVAVAVQAGIVTSTTSSSVSTSPERDPPSVGARLAEILPGVAETQAAVVVAVEALADGDVSASSLFEEAEGELLVGALADESLLERTRSIVFTAVEDPAAALVPVANGMSPPSLASVARFGHLGAGAEAYRSTGGSAGRAAAPSARAGDADKRRSERKPRWAAPAGHAIVLTGSAPSGTSAAPAASSGSSSGGLPIVLFLPLVAVMVDLARRIVLVAAMRPFDPHARMPDTPG